MVDEDSGAWRTIMVIQSGLRNPSAIGWMELGLERNGGDRSRMVNRLGRRDSVVFFSGLRQLVIETPATRTWIAGLIEQRRFWAMLMLEI